MAEHQRQAPGEGGRVEQGIALTIDAFVDMVVGDAELEAGQRAMLVALVQEVSGNGVDLASDALDENSQVLQAIREQLLAWGYKPTAIDWDSIVIETDIDRQAADLNALLRRGLFPMGAYTTNVALYAVESGLIDSNTMRYTRNFSNEALLFFENRLLPVSDTGGTLISLNKGKRHKGNFDEIAEHVSALGLGERFKPEYDSEGKVIAIQEDMTDFKEGFFLDDLLRIAHRETYLQQFDAQEAITQAVSMVAEIHKESGRGIGQLLGNNLVLQVKDGQISGARLTLPDVVYTHNVQKHEQQAIDIIDLCLSVGSAGLQNHDMDQAQEWIGAVLDAYPPRAVKERIRGIITNNRPIPTIHSNTRLGFDRANVPNRKNAFYELRGFIDRYLLEQGIACSKDSSAKSRLGLSVAMIAASLSAAMAVSPEKPSPPEPMYKVLTPDPGEMIDKGRALMPHELEQVYADIATRRDELHLEAHPTLTTTKIAQLLGRTVPNLVDAPSIDPEKLTVSDLEKAGIDMKKTTPLVDLGAFPLDKVRDGTFDAKKLAETGVSSLVIMEDRTPVFFLNYDGFEPDTEVPLNRHGDNGEVWTMKDLRSLIQELQQNGIKVTIGFWANAGKFLPPGASKGKDDNPFLKKRKNWDGLRPVVPTSDDLNIFSFVEDAEGNLMPFFEYVARQYTKIQRDFGLEGGLFIGDGGLGFRSFFDQPGTYDFSDLQYVTTDWYRQLHAELERLNNGEHVPIWVYDCMGNGTAAARRNGVSLEAITPFVDHYVFQSYGADAWGKNGMEIPGYDLARDERHLASLPPALLQKTAYTAGGGDAVEMWKPTSTSIQDKHAALGPYTNKRTTLVWGTHVVQNLW